METARSSLSFHLLSTPAVILWAHFQHPKSEHFSDSGSVHVCVKLTITIFEVHNHIVLEGTKKKKTREKVFHRSVKEQNSRVHSYHVLFVFSLKRNHILAVLFLCSGDPVVD